MRLDDVDTSNVNVEDQRSGGGRFRLPRRGGSLPAGRSMGLGTVVIIVIASLIFGVNPAQFLGDANGAPAQHQANLPSDPVQAQGCDANAASKFSCQVLASANTTWAGLFDGSGYRAPKLVFYSRDGQSGCGAAQSAMGPFYCPADEGIYLDTSFFEELAQRFGAAGDFAQAYVIAHEAGLHIQTITGVAQKVRAEQQRSSTAAGNKLQVAMELQADCYAGVWAARNRERLEAGDVEEGLRAAHQIGNDILQKAAQGVVVPESFTHGSAEQRMRWLEIGLETGDPSQCNAFGT